jgi:hypothetical protein
MFTQNIDDQKIGSHRFESGGGLTEGLVFGRIAGKNASVEKPWS